MRGKISKPPKDVKPLLPSVEGLSDLRLDHMMEAENVEMVVELLKNTRYSSVAKSLDWYREYNSVLPLEFHLRKVYYTTTLEALQSLPSEDRERIGQLLGIEVDITNCYTAAAPVLYEYSTELSKQLIIPHYLRLSPSKVQEAIEAKSPRAVLAYLKSYEEIVKPLLEEKDEALAEVKALSLVRREARKHMLAANIDLAYAICYIILREIERRNLTLIAYMTQENLQTKGYLIV
jgi:vacuolar-type H+-ATPase subunit C/Vma6